MNLQNYLSRQIVWSGRTFGSGQRREGILKHIEKEIAEVREATTPAELLEEACDIAILALDLAWRLGFTAEQVCAQLQKKQDINRARTYPFPASEDEPSEHVRGEPCTCMIGPGCENAKCRSMRQTLKGNPSEH